VRRIFSVPQLFMKDGIFSVRQLFLRLTDEVVGRVDGGILLAKLPIKYSTSPFGHLIL